MKKEEFKKEVERKLCCNICWTSEEEMKSFYVKEEFENDFLDVDSLKEFFERIEFCYNIEKIDFINIDIENIEKVGLSNDILKINYSIDFIYKEKNNKVFTTSEKLTMFEFERKIEIDNI